MTDNAALVSSREFEVSKTYRLKNDIFCLLITFSFPLSYSLNALIGMAEILFSREKVP